MLVAMTFLFCGRVIMLYRGESREPASYQFHQSLCYLCNCLPLLKYTEKIMRNCVIAYLEIFS
jgi:hypothetical protein